MSTLTPGKRRPSSHWSDALEHNDAIAMDDANSSSSSSSGSSSDECDSPLPKAQLSPALRHKRGASQWEVDVLRHRTPLSPRTKITLNSTAAVDVLPLPPPALATPLVPPVKRRLSVTRRHAPPLAADDGHAAGAAAQPAAVAALPAAAGVAGSSNDNVTISSASSPSLPPASSPPAASVPASSSSSSSSASDADHTHPPRMISSYLLKQGKTRRTKWSRRYFTLLPHQFLLVYSHLKGQQQAASSGSSTGTVMRQTSPSVRDEEDEDGEVLVHDDDAPQGQTALARISLHHFRVEEQPDKESLQFTIWLREEGRHGMGYTRSQAVGGRSPNSSGSPSSVTERRLTLRAATPSVFHSWLQQLRRVEHQLLCTQQYVSVVAMNKVFMAQGQAHLVRDPTPFIPAHMAAAIRADAAAAAADSLDRAARPPPSAVSLFTSTLTGDTRASPCTRCGRPFGLLTKRITCQDCRRTFCNRAGCIQPAHMSDKTAEGQRPFSILNMERQRKKSKPPQQQQQQQQQLPTKSRLPIAPPPPLPGDRLDRLCHLCAAQRSSDPVFLRLLYGQCTLLVRVLSGTDLMACDIGGTSDPYVRIRVAGREYRSSAIQGVLNPTWSDAEFTIPWNGTSGGGEEDDLIRSQQQQGLCIEVWDENRSLTDKFMGCIYIEDIEHNVLIEDRFPLRSRRHEGRTGAKATDTVNASTRAAPAGAASTSKQSAAAAAASAAVLSRTTQGGRRIQGHIHVQLMLLSGPFTQRVLQVLPRVVGLEGWAEGAESPWLRKERERRAGRNIDAKQQQQQQPSVLAAPAVPLHPIQTELHAFLSSSRLHPPFRRLLDLLLSFHFLYWHAQWRALFSYQHPARSLAAFVLYVLTVLYLPAEAAPALVPAALLVHLAANAMEAVVNKGTAESERTGAAARAGEEEAAKSNDTTSAARSTGTEAGSRAPTSRGGGCPKLTGSPIVGSSVSQSSTTASARLRSFFSSSPPPPRSPVAPPSSEKRTRAGTDTATSPTPSSRLLAPSSPQSHGFVATRGSSASAAASLLPLVGRLAAFHSVSTPSRSHSAAADQAATPVLTPLQFAQLTPMQREFFEGEVREEEGHTPTSNEEPASSSLHTAHATPHTLMAAVPHSPPSLQLPSASLLNMQAASHITASSVSAVLAEAAPSCSPSLAPASPKPRDSSAAPPSVGVDEDSVPPVSIVLRMRKMKRQVRDVQSLLDGAFDMCEEAIKILTWQDVEKSQRAVRACIVMSIIACALSVRSLLLCAGVWKWSQHLLKLRRRMRLLRAHKRRMRSG